MLLVCFEGFFKEGFKVKHKQLLEYKHCTSHALAHGSWWRADSPPYILLCPLTAHSYKTARNLAKVTASS